MTITKRSNIAIGNAGSRSGPNTIWTTPVPIVQKLREAIIATTATPAAGEVERIRLCAGRSGAAIDRISPEVRRERGREMGWGDQGRQHQTRVSPSQSMTISRIAACPMWVIHLIPAIPACPVCPENGASFGPPRGFACPAPGCVADDGDEPVGAGARSLMECPTGRAGAPPSPPELKRASGRFWADPGVAVELWRKL
jgi:hypothetical protein